MKKFTQNIGPIGLLALLGTYIVAFICHMNMNLWICILLGCIVSQKSGGNFFDIMGKELFGAIIVAVTDVNNILKEIDDIFCIIKGPVTLKVAGSFVII